VVASAVLGAAAGIALLWCPAVFDVDTELYCPSCFNPDPATRVQVCGCGFCQEAIRVRICCLTAHAGVGEWADVWQQERAWNRGAIVSLGLVGGILGAAAGRATRNRLRRPARADWRLGVAAAVTVFVVLGSAGVPGEPAALFDRLPALRYPHYRAKELSALWWEAATLAVSALLVGWAAQVAGGACGVRLPRLRLPEQAADYDDQVVAELVAAADRAGGRRLPG
jgi:hypothetical protein